MPIMPGCGWIDAALDIEIAEKKPSTGVIDTTNLRSGWFRYLRTMNYQSAGKRSRRMMN
jgi:hypothetical protein